MENMTSSFYQQRIVSYVLINVHVILYIFMLCIDLLYYFSKISFFVLITSLHD